MGEPNALLLKRGERGERSADLSGGERERDRFMFCPGCIEHLNFLEFFA